MIDALMRLSFAWHSVPSETLSTLLVILLLRQCLMHGTDHTVHLQTYASFLPEEEKKSLGFEQVAKGAISNPKMLFVFWCERQTIARVRTCGRNWVSKMSRL